MFHNFWFIEKSSSSATPQFTAAEIALYKKRLEEGYDITTDVKYNAWVKLQDTAASKYAAYIAMHVQLHVVISKESWAFIYILHILY